MHAENTQLGSLKRTATCTVSMENKDNTVSMENTAIGNTCREHTYS